MKNYDSEDVGAYIASAETEARPTLKELRELIKSTIPEVEESISYGTPFYKYHGQLAGIAAHKNHAGIWFPVGGLESEEREILEEKGYKTAKKTIQIQYDQKVPTAEIKAHPNSGKIRLYYLCVLDHVLRKTCQKISNSFKFFV